MPQNIFLFNQSIFISNCIYIRLPHSKYKIDVGLQFGVAPKVWNLSRVQPFSQGCNPLIKGANLGILSPIFEDTADVAALYDE